MINSLNINPGLGFLFEQKVGNTPSFVKIFHPNCSHCIAMQNDWDKLVKTIKKNYKGNLYLVNIHADALAGIKHSVFKNINGFPTLMIIKNKQLYKNYEGPRTSKDMLKFCLDNLDLKKRLDKSSKKSHKKKSHKKKSHKKKSHKKK